jgi:MoaA/NifB/PqqE/SkfB family radical SAM enzyme
VNILPYARQARKFIIRNDGTPVYLIFFVTSVCGLRCEHCFYWRNANVPKNELSLDEIGRISAGMGKFLQLTLTGGDACQRDDLAEIAETFYKNNQVRNITLGTNGLNPEKVERLVASTASRCAGADITVELSMDGMPEVHDRIRGVEGAFERARETYGRLQALQKTHGNINTCIDITVSGSNQDLLKPIYTYIRDKLSPDIINVLYVRGEPRNPAAKDVDPGRYEEINRILEEDIRRGGVRSYKFMPDVLNTKDILLRRLILKTVRENRFQLPCTAGCLTGVIQTEGDVYPCELLDSSIGNLRECGYDFPALWQGEKARAIRKTIRDTKCYCIHQCFLSNNILFNPRMVPKFILTYLNLKWNKLRRRVTGSSAGCC